MKQTPINFDESRMRESFQHLRREHERIAPAYPAVAPPRRLPPLAWWVRPAIGVACAAAVVIAVVLLHSPKPVVPTRGVVASSQWPASSAEPADVPWQSQVLVSEWHSPTDFLLRSEEF